MVRFGREHSAKWARLIVLSALIAAAPALSTTSYASASSVSPSTLVHCHQTSQYGLVCHTSTNGNTYAECVTRNGSLTCAIRLGVAFVPTITSLSRLSAPLSGGAKVTITGTGFCHGQSACVPSSTTPTKVKFGTTTAVFTIRSTTVISAIAPPTGAAGAVRVSVVTAGGTSASTPADSFEYVYPVPAVAGLVPSSGPSAGGTEVTVEGSGLTGTTAVYFGTSKVTIGISVNAAGTQLTVRSPAGKSGTTVNVEVHTVGGGTSALSSGARFTYGPVIFSLSRTTGPIAGGTRVSMTGSGFATVRFVKFGSATAASYTVKSLTQIIAVAPEHAAGQVSTSVMTDDGTTPTTSADSYTFH